MVRRYLLNLLIWLDIGFNVILFSGSPHETISSRVGKRADAGDIWACKFCALLDRVFGPQHCKNAEVPDFGETLQWWKKLF